MYIYIYGIYVYIPYIYTIYIYHIYIPYIYNIYIYIYIYHINIYTPYIYTIYIYRTIYTYIYIFVFFDGFPNTVPNITATSSRRDRLDVVWGYVYGNQHGISVSCGGIWRELKGYEDGYLNIYIYVYKYI